MTELARVGDPEAMRALARELSARADLLVQAAGRSPTAALGPEVFAGPAADRARGAGDQVTAQLHAAAGELTEIARSLLGDAEKVEGLNDQMRRLAAADDAPAAAAPAPPPAAPAPPVAAPEPAAPAPPAGAPDTPPAGDVGAPAPDDADESGPPGSDPPPPGPPAPAP